MGEDVCWIHAGAMGEAQKGKSLEEIGREFRDAMLAACEGRWNDTPEWIAPSIDGNPTTAEKDYSE